MTPKRLEKLLKPSDDGALGDLIRRARQMGDLAEALARTLGPELGDGIVAANIRDGGELVVVCRSSAWASRLRFESEAVLDAARESGADVSTCTVRVSQG